jgi:hypothetical protein
VGGWGAATRKGNLLEVLIDGAEVRPAIEQAIRSARSMSTSRAGGSLRALR